MVVSEEKLKPHLNERIQGKTEGDNMDIIHTDLLSFVFKEKKEV
jgi:hypothetical protein